MPALAPNSLIVVTGLTGYIGQHVALAALRAGHRVRGTVRSLAHCEDISAALSKLDVDVDNLSFTIVDDLSDPLQLEKAFHGADGIAHVALPGGVVGDTEDQPAEAIAANLAVLRAAAKEHSVKRVVLTSSSVAVISPPDFKDGALTDKDWNDEIVRRYEKMTPAERKRSPPDVYAAAKTLSEKAAWKWVEENKPTFDLVTILPNANFGPAVQGVPRSTAGWIYAILQNDGSCTKVVPSQWFLDVRDDARLHVLALTTPSLGGRRIWAVAEPFGWNMLLSVLRREFPHVRVPEDVAGSQGEPSPQAIDNSVATEVLGGHWISFEDSVIDTVKGFGY